MPFFLMNKFKASANIASSVNDLVKYMGLHLTMDQSPVLSSYTLRDMHRMHWVFDNWDGGYGLGLELHKIKDWVISGHTGGYPVISQPLLCARNIIPV